MLSGASGAAAAARSGAGVPGLTTVCEEGAEESPAGEKKDAPACLVVIHGKTRYRMLLGAAGETFGALKARLAKLCSTPAAGQRLIFKGKEQPDAQALDAAGAAAGAKILLMLSESQHKVAQSTRPAAPRALDPPARRTAPNRPRPPTDSTPPRTDAAHGPVQRARPSVPPSFRHLHFPPPHDALSPPRRSTRRRSSTSSAPSSMPSRRRAPPRAPAHPSRSRRRAVCGRAVAAAR